MAGWLARTLGASFVPSDTAKTLSKVRQLPSTAQRAMAMVVYAEMFRAVRQVENTPPVSPERDEVIRSQLARAQAARHAAIARGAKDDSDPAWAAAAILENWLMTNSGQLGPKAFAKVDNLIVVWLRTVLSRSDFEEAEKSC